MWSPEGNESLRDSHIVVIQSQSNDEADKVASNERGGHGAFERGIVVVVWAAIDVVWVLPDDVHWVEGAEADESSDDLPEDSQYLDNHDDLESFGKIGASLRAVVWKPLAHNETGEPVWQDKNAANEAEGKDSTITAPWGEKVLKELEWKTNASENNKHGENLHTAFDLEASTAGFSWVWTGTATSSRLNNSDLSICY